VNLTRRLTPLGYRSVLLRGHEGEREGNMDHLARDLAVTPVTVPGLRRGLGPHDVRALRAIIGWLRAFRPDVLHTHTAKAGALGRLGVALAPWWRPRVVVHTFHGHVLKGEFSPAVSRIVALTERMLARYATRLIAVSEEIATDLVQFGVADREKIEVVRLGFDLSPFATADNEREALRRTTREALGIPLDARLVTVIARVAKVKRIDRFLEMAQRLGNVDDVHFLVVGDGDQRPELERSAAARALGDRLTWAGFRRDIPAICFASDVVVLTSDNEGTPVCLIEAQAAAVPVVTTRVGGVRSVVQDGVTGTIVGCDHDQIAAAVRDLLDAPERRRAFGEAGRRHALATFSVERLVADIDRLYRELLREAA
jgi:glycosyltransferase involved in cell wall biosynthesis